MRTATITRTTKETTITISLNLDQQSGIQIATGIGFFDHMLDAFAKHGRFGLTVDAQGDLDVDPHHTIEDTGIVLGECFKQALGDKAGIERFGSAFVPMDESLARAVVDLSGRAYLVFDAELTNQRLAAALIRKSQKISSRRLPLLVNSTCMPAFCMAAIPIIKLRPYSKHWVSGLRAAVAINPEVQGIPSTKGVI